MDYLTEDLSLCGEKGMWVGGFCFLCGGEELFFNSCATLVYIHLTWINSCSMSYLLEESRLYSSCGEPDQLFCCTGQSRSPKTHFHGGKEEEDHTSFGRSGIYTLVLCFS